MKDEDGLKQSLISWRDRYVSAVNEAKRANLEAGQVKKEALDAIYGQVEEEGGKPLLKAFKAAMTTLDHADKARGKRDDVADSLDLDEDTSVLDAFDRLMLEFDPQLSLFSESVREAILRNAEHWPPPDNVVPMESAA